MSLGWDYLVTVDSGDTPVPISSLHTVGLLALMTRHALDHLDTLAEDGLEVWATSSHVYRDNKVLV